MFQLKECSEIEAHQNFAQKYKEYTHSKFIPCVYLLKAGSEALRAFEKFLSKYNFSQAKFLILMILMRNPKKSLIPTEIARIMGVKKPTITGVIDGLLRENLVTREQDESDRRKIMIKISKKGIEQIEKILPEYFTHMNKIMDNFDEFQLNSMKDLLINVLSNTEKLR